MRSIRRRGARKAEDDLLIMTRKQLEQALQSSELQEIVHNAGNNRGASETYTGPSLTEAIIDRLFMWQDVNEATEKEPDAPFMEQR